MVQIQLEDEVAAALADRARSRGLSIAEFLSELLAGERRSTLPPLKGDEAIRLIEAETGPGSPSYQGTYPREDIYVDHD